MSKPRGLAAPLVLLPAWLLLCGTPVRSVPAVPAAPPSQYDVQAVYLFDFAKFVRWPEATTHDAVDLCLAGAQKGFSEALEHTVAGETISGRALKVHAVDKSADVAGCDLLFVDAQYKNQAAMMEAASGKPILTVSDAPGFLQHGGMIQMVTEDARVRFSVNLTPVSRSGLSLSSELLKVAVKVTGTADAGGTR